MTDGFAKFGLAVQGVRSALSMVGGPIVEMVRLAGEAEQTAISFEVMTGSVETATSLISDLRKMGAATPFEFTDLSNSTKTLLSFGRASNQVLSDLDMLSNVAAGDANKLQSLSLVFGQIAANGRLTGGDLLQLVNTGFNPLNQIAAKTGETMGQLRDRMSKGKVGFEEVRQAFVDATSAGGIFYKMNEKQSQTILGKWSTLKDEVTGAMIEMGEAIIKNLDLKSLTEDMTKMVSAFKEIIPVIASALEGFAKLSGKVSEFVSGVGEINKAVGKSNPLKAVVNPVGFAAKESSNLFKAGFGGIKQPTKTSEDPRAIRARMEAVMGAARKADEANTLKLVAEQQRKAAEQAKAAGMVGELDSLLAAEPQMVFAEQQKSAMIKNMGEQLMAGLIRDGMSAVKSGLMSLGPAVEDTGPTPQLSSMEKNSQEAFDVIQANIGPDTKDVQKNQLKALEKLNKQTDELLKEMGRSAKKDREIILKVAGID